MTRRERTLLAAVVASLVLAGLMVGARRVGNWFTTRTDRIEQLESDIHARNKQIIRGIAARKAILTYEQRSLPSESELASSRYRDWLHKWLIKANVADHKVVWQGGQRLKGVYDKHTFAVTCQGSLEQWVTLLYEFYRADHLHRIKTMTANPLKEGQLSIAFTIEALSLPGAGADKELSDAPSQRLAYQSLGDYLERIVTRNPYGPANEPPRFASDTTQRAYVGRPTTLRIQARDPEGKRVHYRLVGTLPGDPRFDDRSGALSWTPPEKGEYEVKIVAEDEGTPPKQAESTFRIVVDDPPPEDPKPPAFDVAKYTYLTAIVAVDGRFQAWLHDRPEDRLLKLFQGDEFDLGVFHGKVEQIDPYFVDILADGSIVRIRPGQNLRQGTKVQREAVAEAK